MSYQDLPHLKLQQTDKLLWITLNNPESMNSITLEMIDSLTRTLRQADVDPSVEIILIRGEGNAFSSGGDVLAMHEKSGMFAGDSNELRLRYQHGIQMIPKTMEDISKPVIAVVNGAAVGAGCDLAMMCDIRIGSAKSKFSESFGKLGLVPGDGGTFFLQRVVGFAKAMQMTLTCEMIEGQKALEWGLLNYLVSESELFLEAEKLAQQICKNGSVSLSMAKKALKISYLHDIHTTLDLLAAYQGIAQRTSYHQEAVEKFVNKSKAVSKSP